jgi:CheY-like chemotaxis protein
MKKRVLLVEDDLATVDVMRQELEFLGYDVTVAGDGEVALGMVGSEPPDLIVMDVRMPKMDGLQAAHLIKENPTTQHIPILAATAKALPGDREKCLASGYDGYIAKPFTAKQLGVAIQRLFRS